MAIDLLGLYDYPPRLAPADYLVARLCEEAGVCQGPDHLPYDDSAVLSAAIYEVDLGLLVQDGSGRWFRLRVTAVAHAGPENTPPG